jgi:hypothetical protein
MRVNRDRRGYETTSLTETGGRRRKGQRLLYYFRTPPSVRVGREAIDPEAMRMLEQHNPDVSFDWDRLLRSGSSGTTASAGTGPGSAGPDSRDERRRDRRDQRRQRSGPPVPAAAGVADELDVITAEPAEAVEALDAAARHTLDGPAGPEEPVEPGPVQLQEPAQSGPAEPVAPSAHEPVEERYARLGADGLRRLRARYADIKGRLGAKTMDEGERSELSTRLERLNPDAWETDDDVARGIDEYEIVFESFRGVVGRPPRRRRL